MEIVNLSQVKSVSTIFENQGRLKSYLQAQIEPVKTLYVKHHISAGASRSPTSPPGHPSRTKTPQFNMKICSILLLHNSASNLNWTPQGTHTQKSHFPWQKSSHLVIARYNQSKSTEERNLRFWFYRHLHTFLQQI